MPATPHWEYRVLTVGAILKETKDVDLEALLNEWGEQGWELVTTNHMENSNKIRLVARRPLTAVARRQRSVPGY